MKEIPLTQGYVAIVDDEDYERVAAHKWCANVQRRADCSVRVYARRAVPRPGGGQTNQFMHVLLLGTPAGMNTDHINGNGLDNRRSNLRICTRSENLRNQRPQTGRSSSFKGVSWHNTSSMWRAQIKFDGEVTHLGLFASERDAAAAYDAAAIEMHGEFAQTNGEGVCT